MDEVGRGTSTFDGLALAWAIARQLLEKNRALTLFATHYFEMTRIAQEYKEAANVHLDAVEHKDSIVFLHAVEEGPASQSYGLQVAQLAGVPKAVIQRARRILQQLEEASRAGGSQADLFARPARGGTRARDRRAARGARPGQSGRALAARSAGAALPVEEAVSAMRLADIGANLTHASFREDLDAVLARARHADVETIVVTGTSVEDSRRAAELAAAHGLYATAGVHPHHARDCDARTIPALREIAAHPRVVAIGECGLDYNRNYSPHPDQEKWFVAQLELAAELGKPLFLHSRDAHPRFAEILQEPARRQGGGALLHRRGRGAARLSRPGPVHRHHRLDLRRAARRPPDAAGEGDSAATGCCWKPTRPTSRRATCARSPRRGATSPRTCRTSCAPWRARAASQPKRSPRRRRGTRTRSSASHESRPVPARQRAPPAACPGDRARHAHRRHLRASWRRVRRAWPPACARATGSRPGTAWRWR